MTLQGPGRGNPHWLYFLSVEEDILKLSRYVEIHRNNNATYSIELLRLLFAASAEVDVVLNSICQKIDSEKKAENIEHFRKIIMRHLPDIAEMKIDLPRFGFQIVPWERWKEDKSPKWWKAYTNVKHHRDEHYRAASLQHALAASAGLFAALLFLFRIDTPEIIWLAPRPQLFWVASHDIIEDAMVDGAVGIRFN